MGLPDGLIGIVFGLVLGGTQGQGQGQGPLGSLLGQLAGRNNIQSGIPVAKFNAHDAWKFR